MKAVWYERTGPAREVLCVGEMPTPEAGPGEVRVRLEASGVNPADVGRRSGGYRAMDNARVIPNSDGAGIIDQVGEGVMRLKPGQRAEIDLDDPIDAAAVRELMEKCIAVRALALYALPWPLLAAAQTDIGKWLAAAPRLHNIAAQYPLSATSEAHLAVRKGRQARHRHRRLRVPPSW